MRESGHRRRAALVSLLLLVSTTGAVAQSPGPSASPDATLPPPPAWFDPSVLRFVMSREGELDHTRTGDPLLVAAVDGSGMEAIEAPPFYKAQLAADGRIVLLGTTDTDALPPLLIRDPDGSLRTLSPAASDFWLDTDRDDVYSFGKGPGDGAYGLWRLPLDGREPNRVLSVYDQEDIVMSADGRSIAVGQKGDPGDSFLRARFDGGPQRDLGSGYPIGFDPQGRLFFGGFTKIGFDLLGSLWYRALSTNGRPSLARVEVRTGTARIIRRLTAHDRAQAITSDGRNLVTLTDGDGVGHVRIVDLVEGDRWSVAIPHGSQLLDASGRYLLFGSIQGDISGTTVIDTLERWAGLVPRTAD